MPATFDTRPAGSNPNSKPIKLRTPCDSCFSAKVRCDANKQGCRRCAEKRLNCHYSELKVGKVVGKRRKRPLPDNMQGVSADGWNILLEESSTTQSHQKASMTVEEEEEEEEERKEKEDKDEGGEEEEKEEEEEEEEEKKKEKEQKSLNPNSKPIKLRSACNSCFSAKVRCDGIKPSCKRCSEKRLDCHYSEVRVSKVVGKRRKRPLPDNMQGVSADGWNIQLR